MSYHPLPVSAASDKSSGDLPYSLPHHAPPVFQIPRRIDRKKYIVIFVLVVLVTLLASCSFSLRQHQAQETPLLGDFLRQNASYPYQQHEDVTTGYIEAQTDDRTVHEFDLPLNYTGTHQGVPVNSTLGFEKIYVLNLPSRVDKRDELALMAYASGVRLEFLDAVTKEEIGSLSIAQHAPDMLPTLLGSYRSHINALRKVLEDGVESALILEDDVDWSVDVKKTFQSFQDPLATLIGSMKKDRKTRGPIASAPYGEADWDLLYLGACLEGAWAGPTVEKKPLPLVGNKTVDYDAPPYLVYEDETAPDGTNMGDSVKEMFRNYGLQIDMPDALSIPRRRVIQRSRGPICTDSYAVTRRGAARLLYQLTRTLNAPIDLAMAWAAGDGRVESYTVFPPIMDQWRVAGNFKNSDINGKRDLAHGETGGEEGQQLDKRHDGPDVGISLNIHNSVRGSLHRLLDPKFSS
ncbi:hypothetical protein CBS101457_004952 [Exobasidium rhododendri]|nr:hypothetical protein CBS101457_004952 [Exobasidium rhododendri]